MIDASTMLANVSELVPYVSVLIQTVAGLLGILTIALGLHKFYLHNTRGESQVGTAFLFLLSGVALINLTLSINATFDLLYGGSGASVENLVAYEPGANMPTQAGMVMHVIILLVQVYGLFFSVTGWHQLRLINDNRQAADATFKGTMFRILGGAALLNIVLTVNLIAGILGFGKVL